MDTLDWIKNSSLPDIDDLTKLDVIDYILGPWILLNGYVSEESGQMDRNLYFICKVFLIEPKSSKRLMSCWEKAEQQVIRSPELNQTEYLYSGELNCLPGSRLDSGVEFKLVVGTKIEKRRQGIFTGKDGTPVLTDGEKLIDVEVPAVEYIKAYSPVAQFFWGAGDGAMPSVGAKVLTSKVAEPLGLKVDPVSLDITDIQGNIAARNISFKGRGYGNRRDLFYMREDLLIRFMTEEKLDLVWFVEGERRIARLGPVHASSDIDDEYKKFRFCKRYEVNR